MNGCRIEEEKSEHDCDWDSIILIWSAANDHKLARLRCWRFDLWLTEPLKLLANSDKTKNGIRNIWIDLIRIEPVNKGRPYFQNFEAFPRIEENL